jgi:CheY-like chemotaxis protein
MRNACILIIDDDAGIADSLSTLLIDEGYRVEVAYNGSKGLEYLANNDLPSVILLDLMMPVMDGFTFRKEQSEDPRISKIPTIIMTAGVLDVRATSLNASAYLKKPLDIDKLLETIGQYH